MASGDKIILIVVTIDYQLNYHKGLFELLVAKGWKVHVVSTPGSNLGYLSGIDGVVTHGIHIERRPSLVVDIRAMAGIVRVFRKTRPSVLLTGTPKASLLSLIVATMFRTKRREYMVHGLRFEGAQGWRRKFLIWLERLLCSLSTGVIPVSASVRENLVGSIRVDAEKVRLLGHGSCNGVDVELFHHGASSRQNDVKGYDSRDPVIGFVGRLTRDKGLPTMAAALKTLKNDGMDLTLLVVGGVDDESGKEGMGLLSRTGQNIISTGFVPMPEAEYLKMDALVLPSLREGLPNVILEAFASGVIVVGTGVTGICDLVDDGVTGILVKPSSPEDLANGIKRAITKKEETKRMVATAHNFVLERYDRATVLDLQASYLDGVPAPL